MSSIITLFPSVIANNQAVCMMNQMVKPVQK